MKNISNFTSYLFHPLLMTTYGCLILFFCIPGSVYDSFTPLRLKFIITGIVFVLSCLLPILNLLLLLKLNYITSLKIETRTERIMPLIITSVFYFGLYYLLLDLNIWPTIKLFVLGAGICILLAGIITIWWQISAHLIGIGGLIGAFIALCYYVQLPVLFIICVSILIAGIVGFARLQLNTHTPNQIYVGFSLGAITQFLLFFIAQHFNF